MITFLYRVYAVRKSMENIEAMEKSGKMKNMLKSEKVRTIHFIEFSFSKPAKFR